MTKGHLFARIEPLFDVGAFADLRVMIAGCGAGGDQVALHLAMSGVRRFVLVDKGGIEQQDALSHVCGARYVGARRTKALADVLRDRNPGVEVREFDCDLMAWPGLEAAVGRASVVVVGAYSDRVLNRLNTLCVKTSTPLTVGRVFRRGIGGEVYSYRPGRWGCFGCLELSARCRKLRDLLHELKEVDGSPGLAVDRSFISNFHTRFTLDVLGAEAPERPRFLTPLNHNYLQWGNRAVGPFGMAFESRRLAVKPAEDCRFCGGR